MRKRAHYYRLNKDGETITVREYIGCLGSKCRAMTIRRLKLGRADIAKYIVDENFSLSRWVCVMIGKECPKIVAKREELKQKRLDQWMPSNQPMEFLLTPDEEC